MGSDDELDHGIAAVPRSVDSIERDGVGPTFTASTLALGSQADPVPRKEGVRARVPIAEAIIGLIARDTDDLQARIEVARIGRMRLRR